MNNVYIWNNQYSAVASSIEEAIGKICKKYNNYLQRGIDPRDEKWQHQNPNKVVKDTCDLLRKTLEENTPFIFQMKSIGGISDK